MTIDRATAIHDCYINNQHSTKEQVLKLLADKITDNIQLCELLEELQRENIRIKKEREYTSRVSYERGWNDATKKVRNFIKRHMERTLIDED